MNKRPLIKLAIKQATSTPTIAMIEGRLRDIENESQGLKTTAGPDSQVFHHGPLLVKDILTQVFLQRTVDSVLEANSGIGVKPRHSASSFRSRESTRPSVIFVHRTHRSKSYRLKPPTRAAAKKAGCVQANEYNINS